MTKTIIHELCECVEELTLLIKQDWEKSKQFIKKHKTYFFWILALFISMQFTDVLSLGKSWDIYCKKHNIQNGSGNDVSVNSSTKQAEGSAVKQDEGSAVKQAEGSAVKQAEGSAVKQAEGSAVKQAEGSADKQVENGPTKGTGSPPSKGKLSKKIGKSKASFTSSIKSNPVFGNLDKVFDMTEGMFTILIFILVIVGVLSLPVIIFIIITYCIIKNLCSRLAIL